MNKSKYILIKRLLPLVVILIVIFLSYHIIGNYLEIRNLETEIAEMEERIEEAEKKQEQLGRELQRLDDPEYIERLARRKLGLVRPGEELIIPYDVEDEDE